RLALLEREPAADVRGALRIHRLVQRRRARARHLGPLPSARGGLLRSRDHRENGQALRQGRFRYRALQSRDPDQQSRRRRPRLHLRRRPRQHRAAHPRVQALMDLGIGGKCALVTGASMGIGRAIALSLAKEGVRLAVVARRRALLEELQRETGKLVMIEQDFLAPEAPERIARAALAGLGQVDILVNNAGGSRRFTLESTDEQWEEALTLNFRRHRQLTHLLLEQMMARKWGRIINITGKSEPEGLNGAFAAKAAVHAWSKGLSREVGKHGITVNCIPPGRIMSEQIRRKYSDEFRAEQSASEIPVGRYGEPEELAALAVFLCSPVARYITGTVMPVDGGLRRYAY